MTELGLKTTKAEESAWAERSQEEMSLIIDRAKRQTEGYRLSKRTPQEGMASTRALRWLLRLFSDCRIRLTDEERAYWYTASKEQVRLKTNELQRRKLQLRDMAGLEPQPWRVKRGWA